MSQSPPEPTPPPDLEALRQAIGSGDPMRAMPALAGLRQLEAGQAVPLLLLGLEQEPFIVRSLSCAGLGLQRNEAGWQVLLAALAEDADANVRAEAANALARYGVERAWPHLRDSFARDDQWLVRCSILSALAEQPDIAPESLLELAEMAITDADGTVRVGAPRSWAGWRKKRRRPTRPPFLPGGGGPPTAASAAAGFRPPGRGRRTQRPAELKAC